MKTKRLQRQESRGMVLVTCLTTLSVLLAVGVGIRIMLQNDYRALANMRGSTEAFYFSGAGLEWSKSEIASVTAFPPAPPNQTKSFASGGFAVTFLSPAATGPLTAKVTVRSVGTIGNASHTVQAQLTKTYDLADGAAGLRGNFAGVNLSGSGILFSGADHDPANGNLLGGVKPRSAISTSNDTARGLVAQAVSDPAMLDGASAVPALTQSSYLPASVVTQLADDLCAAPGALSHPISPAGSLILENQTWGSQSSPQLHCVDGLATPGDAVTLTGNVSGVGILVIRNADLVVTGSFRWEGLVVVTGQEIGLKATGSSSKDVIGAAVMNETGNPGNGTAILDIQGSFRILFSRQALRQAAPLIPTTTLSSLYSALPAAVAQDYWRTVSP
jgi:Tfp pilus assembly protein PilX